MIRRATTADAAWFAEQASDYLAESGDPLRYDAAWTLERVAALLEMPSVLAFVDEGRGHILATVVPSLYHPDDVVCRVSTVWVRPEHRGKGIGVRLIRRVEAQVPGALLLIDSNLSLADAGPMYERMGYQAAQVLYQKVNDGH